MLISRACPTRAWAWGLALVAVSATLLCGCRATRPTLTDARSAFYAGDFPAAETTLEDVAKRSRQNRDVAELDLALIELARGEAESAENRLRSARDHFDSNVGALAVGDAAGLATDDNARPFRLPDYQQVLLRSMLAVCSLAQDGTDAEAYCLQARQKQQALARAEGAEADPVAYQPVAFAPYLYGTLREATHRNYDDAERLFRLVSTWEPEFAPSSDDIQRVSSGTHSAPGNGVLYVIGLVGVGPQLIETEAPTTTASLQIASSLIRTVRKESKRGDDEEEDDAPVLPNIAQVKVPRVYVPPSQIEAIGVSSSGTLLGATQSVTDLARLAVERSDAEMNQIIARAVARRVLKETSVTTLAESMGLTGPAKSAFEFAAMNAWSASEHADTRCWGLLPRQIQVLRAEIPAGVHRLQLDPLSYQGVPLGSPAVRQVRIEDGRNHYVIAMAPDQILSVIASTKTVLDDGADSVVVNESN